MLKFSRLLYVCSQCKNALACDIKSSEKLCESTFFRKKLCRVPTRYWKYWKSIEFWNQFSRPWKIIELGQIVHEVL